VVEFGGKKIEVKSIDATSVPTGGLFFAPAKPSSDSVFG
jgi:hypothetical protein